ncbi:fructose-bisphosphate aldolase [Solibacillus merdavium]|uniref:Fructose-bisphosphate aldolase n=1 Tax=Solibacillus merdavium TaxID=2762218 RepID=A0ABR8XMN2_9BACL|nr:fructose-bisphosphate aldolase [Solibacillus merdavium]MBD8033161.1 fructose-bisphosphate aldolase [Solibacillus merdavium]
MKKFSLLFTGLFFLLLTACSNEEPSIEIEVKVSSISDEEYSKVGATQDLIDPKQEDFKVLEYTFNMKHTNAVINRHIESFEDWRNALNSIDEIDRYWYGGGSSRDNESENFSEYQTKLVYYAKGLSEEELKEAFSNSKTTVTWVDKENEQIIKQYKIADLIEFSNE